MKKISKNKQHKINNKFVEIPVNNISIAGKKLIHGVGKNDAGYKIQFIVDGKQLICPYYRKWRSMIERVYDFKYHTRQPTYKDATVAKEWLLFSNFKKWMKCEPNNHLQLDKDLLIKGNKHYSPNTCIFISRELNNLFTNHKAKRGAYKIGVSFSKKANRYIATINIYGKSKHIGNFATEMEAYNAYIDAKIEYIKHIVATNPYNDSDKAIKALSQYSQIGIMI